MKKSELENNEDYVECKDCGHIVAKGRAQRIMALTGWAYPEGYQYDIRYYCELHKKPYDKETFIFGKPTEYYKQFQVSEDGTPIGYKKITPKK